MQYINHAWLYRMYAPYCVPSFLWFALKIDLMERTIYIYDNLWKYIRVAQLAECMKYIQLVIPWSIKVEMRDKNFSAIDILLSKGRSS